MASPGMEQRNRLAQAEGFKNYYEKRTARAEYKKLTGGDAAKGASRQAMASKMLMLRGLKRIDKPTFDTAMRRIGRVDPHDRVAMTKLFSG